MSEKPILFSGPMVRAILDGKKSQTRRVIKPQPQYLADVDLWETYATLRGPEIYQPVVENSRGECREGPFTYGVYSEDGEWGCKCPVVPGDRLWVRETWSYYEDAELFDCIRYKADGGVRKPKFDDFPGVSENVWYQFEMMCDGYGCADHKWRSPVCMPRWASRLTLEVTGVRVERLQEISEADAIAEGIERCDLDISAVQSDLVNHSMECDRFARLWDSINKKTHPWESNPWVWAYEFRRVEA